MAHFSKSLLRRAGSACKRFPQSKLSSINCFSNQVYEMPNGDEFRELHSDAKLSKISSFIYTLPKLALWLFVSQQSKSMVKRN